MSCGTKAEVPEGAESCPDGEEPGSLWWAACDHLSPARYRCRVFDRDGHVAVAGSYAASLVRTGRRPVIKMPYKCLAYYPETHRLQVWIHDQQINLAPDGWMVLPWEKSWQLYSSDHVFPTRRESATPEDVLDASRSAGVPWPSAPAR